VQVVGLEEFHKGRRDMLAVDLTSLSAHVDVHQVALQNSVGTGMEDANENRGHSVGDDEDQQDGDEGALNVHSFRGHRLDQQEANKGGTGSDADLTNEHEDRRHAINHRELNRVLQSEEEGVDSGTAEGLVRESQVDISIPGQVADKSVEAVQDTSAAADKAFGAAVLACSVFHLLSDVLEESTDDPYNSKDAGAESKRTEVVSDCPHVAHPYFRVSRDAVRVRNILAGKVPGDSGHNDNELVASDNEGNNPNDSEPESVHHPVGFRGPSQVLDLTIRSLSGNRVFGDGAYHH